MTESFIERNAIERWNHGGIECAICPSPQGGLNGYVQIPAEARRPNPPPSPEHGWLSADVLTATIHCHGGITYGPDEDGWLGFDTGHAGDLWPEHIVEEFKDPYIFPPGMPDLYSIQREHRQPWTMDWTLPRLRRETEALATEVYDLTYY